MTRRASKKKPRSPGAETPDWSGEAGDVESLKEDFRRLVLTSGGKGALLSPTDPGFRQLFQEHPQAMWVYDRETLRLLEVNRAALARLGRTREELLALRVTDLRLSGPRLMGWLRTDPRGRESSCMAGIYRHHLPDGQAIDLEITSHDVEFAFRPAVLAVTRDVTELRQLRARLAESEGLEDLGRMAVEAAEACGFLVTSIAGHASVLASRMGAGHPLLRNVEEMQRAAQRAVDLMRPLLAYGLSEAKGA